MARKVKLTKEMQDNICSALRVGNFCAQAAEANGLSESSFWRYMEQGEDVNKARLACEDMKKAWKPTEADMLMLGFWEAVTRARAEAEITAVTYLRKAMPEDWRAAMAFLERAYPKRWGKRLIKPEDERDEIELTQAQVGLAAEAIANAFKSMGHDLDDPDTKRMMRDALEQAADRG